MTREHSRERLRRQRIDSRRRVDDPLAQLPASVRASLEAALACADWKDAQTDLNDAFDGVAWPEAPASIPLASELTGEQLALAHCLTARPGTWTAATRRLPQSQWNRRCWLGIDPPSALERPHTFEGETAPLWRLAADRHQDGKAMVDLLLTVPVPDRIEAFRDLCLRAYQTFISEYQVGPTLIEQGFGDDAAAWAASHIDGLLAHRDPADRVRHQSLDRWLLTAVFLPVARAGIPIERRWEPLLPLGRPEWTRECLMAVAPKRRDAALKHALKRELDDEGVLLACLSILPVHRSSWLVKKVVRKAKKHSRLTELEVLTEIAGHVEGEPPLEALVAEELERSKERSVSFKVRRVTVASQRTDVPEHLHDQLAEAGDPELLFDSDARLTIVELSQARSTRRYVAFIHHVDTGVVFRAGGTEVVARMIQMSIECRDEAFGRGLETALAKALAKSRD